MDDCASYTLGYVHVSVRSKVVYMTKLPEGKRKQMAKWSIKSAAQRTSANTAQASGNTEWHPAEHIASGQHTHRDDAYALHENVVPKPEKPLSHLLLRNINDTDPDVRAPLSDHSHRWASHITGAHTADVVLELLGSHGVSCGEDGGGKGVLLLVLLVDV